MGIILAPLFIGFVFIYIKTILQFIPMIKNDELTNQIFVIGIAIPILIIIYNVYLWIQKKSVYAFTPVFAFIFSLVYLPMIIKLLIENILPIQNTFNLSAILTLWIITGGFLFVPLYIYLTDFLKGKGVKFHY